jgi:hypothetical protein
MNPKITYPPDRLLSLAWIFAVHAKSSATDAKINTDRNVEKYRGAAVVVVALMMKPIAASEAARATNGPRILYRSDSPQKRMMTKKQRR